MFKRILFAGWVGLFSLGAGLPGFAAEANLLQTLRPEHPRLLVLNDRLEMVKAAVKSDPKAGALYQQLLADAEQILKEPVLTYEIGGPEHTLLSVSREVEGRVWLLAGLYRLNGDTRFAARARDEMLAASRFPDWYPKHFLDTAEMTAALGVGYDWLFDYLSPQERLVIRGAIVAKGLNPGIAGLSDNGRLYRMHNNWVQVCNGGLTLGALAIADEERTTAARLINLTRQPMSKIMELFAPDGGFEEGPIYWDYATSYNVFYLSALDTALRTDFGLSRAKGFDLTGNYRMQTIGPTDKCANFGDASESVDIAPQMLWMARKFDHPEYAWHEHSIGSLLALNPKHGHPSRFAIMELLWDEPTKKSLVDATLPTGKKFDRIATAFLRSGWGDAAAIYVGFKGGSNHASHGHLDLGSFVLDAFGERWALDLGADSYGLPGYFGTQRWSYYRMRTEGHNTLTVNNQNEDLKADSPLTAFSDAADQSYAIANLDAAYPNQLADWHRGIKLLNRRQVLVQDDLRPKTACDVVWNFHTRAAITISSDGAKAVLSEGKSKLVACILSPLPAKFEDLTVSVPAPQNPISGVHNLIIRLPQISTKTTIGVLLESPDDNTTPPKLVSLEQWGS